MRGIILAGGTGSRLYPLTHSQNKHILPCGNVPMIYHPLRVLLDNGISDITIVSTPSGVGQISQQLSFAPKSQGGEKVSYVVQNQPGGIVQALACANRDQPDNCVVLLGDNVFFPSPVITKDIEPRCWLNKASDLSGFGVPTFGRNGNIMRVTEKPPEPASEYAVTGLYKFPFSMWEAITKIKPSERGETEITDLLNLYAGIYGNYLLAFSIHSGFWGDAGTFAGLMECSKAAMEFGKADA